MMMMMMMMMGIHVVINTAELHTIHTPSIMGRLEQKKKASTKRRTQSHVSTISVAVSIHRFGVDTMSWAHSRSLYSSSSCLAPGEPASWLKNKERRPGGLVRGGVTPFRVRQDPSSRLVRYLGDSGS
jgi:hypothetical protein